MTIWKSKVLKEIMVTRIKNKVIAKVINDPIRLVVLIGAETFFFGFALGGIINAYLLFTGSSLVEHFRGTLTFKSAIVGDGIILPVVNMVIVAFLIANKEEVSKRILRSAVFSSIIITSAFHLVQAKYGFINWSMPEPWHWNGIGVLHATYMSFAIFLISLFFMTAARIGKKTGITPSERKIVSGGIIIFIILLAWDYGLIL